MEIFLQGQLVLILNIYNKCDPSHQNQLDVAFSRLLYIGENELSLDYVLYDIC